ncbi:hypothetical protein HDE_03786 [Halotydeus destructor]|nr:hypothetical protein HDE_03786 [Halotydeus destructor]
MFTVECLIRLTLNHSYVCLVVLSLCHSTSGDLPVFEATNIERSLLIQIIGNSVTLNCSKVIKSLNDDYFWKNGSKLVDNSTEGRLIVINQDKQLIVQNVQIHDQNWYSCHIGDKPVSVTQLIVRRPNQDGQLLLILVQNIGSWYILFVVVVLVYTLRKNSKFKLSVA